MQRLQRIAFFGTPEFAVPTLEALVATDRTPVIVVTQPPRPSGRGQKLRQPPVAKVAESLGLPLLQPKRVRKASFLEPFADLRIEVAVVVAFGQIFPTSLLSLPEHGCINVHASLLPAYRGAAPIQAALAAGDERTGVTTMQMEEGLDTGPMLLQESLEIGRRETAGELAPRLAALGGALLVKTLERLEAGVLTAIPQPEDGVSYAPRIKKEDGRVDWSLTASGLANRLRAFTPWPGLTASLGGTPVKIIAAEPVAPQKVPYPGLGTAEPGEVLGVHGGRLLIACGEGTVLGVERLQKAGRRAVEATAFVNGERLSPGASFDGSP